MLMKIAFALLLLASIVYAAAYLDRENPASQRQAQQELDNFRGFAFSVERFVGGHYGYAGRVSWAGGEDTAALRDAGTTPASLRGVNLPRNWQAHVFDGDYVLCVRLSEAAVALMAASMPEGIAAAAMPGSARAIVLASASELYGDPEREQEAEAAQWLAECTP